MQVPKHIISVWPQQRKNSSVKALVQIILGDAISIFPIRLMEGKRGLHLLFPKEKRVYFRTHPIVMVNDSEAVAQLTKNVIKTYHPEKATCRSFSENGELEIQCRTLLWDRSIDRMVATAFIKINHMLTITGIRLIEIESGARLVLFPERECKENGEAVVKRMVDFRNEWEDFITKAIWQAYDEELALKHRERRGQW